MKNKSIFNRSLTFWPMVIFFIFTTSCGPKSIDQEIFGTWNSKKHSITVRTKDENNKFQFTSDTCVTTLTINEDKTVSGKIGMAAIENGRIRTNWVLPSNMTGVSYTIKCELSGKIFENDPLETKKVEFWIGPDFENDDWELRYTTGGSQFPMAFIYFSKGDQD